MGCVQDIIFTLELKPKQLHVIEKLGKVYVRIYNLAVCAQYAYWTYTQRVLSKMELKQYLIKNTYEPSLDYNCIYNIIPRVIKEIWGRLRWHLESNTMEYIRRKSIHDKDFTFSLRFDYNLSFYTNEYVEIPQIRTLVYIDLKHNPFHIEDGSIRTLYISRANGVWQGIVRKLYKTESVRESIYQYLKTPDVYYDEADFECPLLR